MEQTGKAAKLEPCRSSASGELWGFHFMPDQLTVDVLMPNGILIPIFLSRNSTLQTVKENVWKEAKRMPLFSLLQVPSAYVFTLVTQDGKSEEIYDETRRLCDLRMFLPVLRLLEPEGNVQEKSNSYLISQAVGRPVLEFDESRDPELIKARLQYYAVCRDVADEQERDLAKALLRHYCLPTVAVPQGTSAVARRRAKLDMVTETASQHLLLCVWIQPHMAVKAGGSRANGGHRNKITIKVPLTARPKDVISELLLRLTKLDSSTGANASDAYVLKQPSREMYLLNDVELVNYTYIAVSVDNEQPVNLVLAERRSLVDKARLPSTFHVPSFVKRQTTGAAGGGDPAFVESVCMWNMQSNFRIKIISTYNINVTSDDYVYVKAGIFFGPHRLSVHGTSAIPCSDLRWNEVLEFDLPIYQIPLGAHISFSLCSIRQKKQKDGRCPLGWINLRVIDYQDCLIQGKHSLYMWPFPKAFEGLFNPVGQLGPNSNRSVPCLQVDFGTHERRIRFPSQGQRKLYGKFFEKERHWTIGKGRFWPGGRLASTVGSIGSGRRSSSLKDHWSSVLPPIAEITEQERVFICEELINRDPLHQMTQSERQLIWRCRHFLQTLPEALPRLLDAVCWTNTSDVCELYSLLQRWPTVSPLVAMELLDVRYPDNYVRKFAVQCLNKTLPDDQLAMYLIYLVQVMKYEPFLQGDLGKFLLRRALSNAHIGHLFFWLLRVELAHNPRCNRFGLLLEAYCRGAGTAYLQDLVRQVNALDKLCTLSAAIKERREDWAKLLQERMRQPDYLEALQNLACPLDHTLALGELMVDKCHVICSAKRPLLLVWKTAEAVGELRTSVEILFKMGDDLRQDMLTLQVLKSMDNIWKADNMNLFLTPYHSLPMGKHVGMIEIVKNSKTIMEILSGEGRKGAFNIGSSALLYRYIKQVNKKDEQAMAIDRFTKSCAGYCVATFVLGIGDRHPSNIMITKDGRIFHVDFGHFLGHYKKKLGISRERVPFVLTDDFIRVIARGAENGKKSKEFEAFQQLCGEAYLILHRHGRLFITLFTMMLCMGIPELQKLEDINYMRKTLAADQGDHEALKHFNEQLNRAYEGAWTTKVDWFFHSVKHM